MFPAVVGQGNRLRGQFGSVEKEPVRLAGIHGLPGDGDVVNGLPVAVVDFVALPAFRQTRGQTQLIAFEVHAEQVTVSGNGSNQAPVIPSPIRLTIAEGDAAPQTASINPASPQQQMWQPAPHRPAGIATTAGAIAPASSLIVADGLQPWSPSATGDEQATASEVEEVAQRFASACRDHGIRLAGIDVAGF